jgi:HSP20 family protein
MTLVKFANQMPSLIDRFFNDDLFDWSIQNFSNNFTNLPAVNIKEKNDAFEIEMAAPGFNKEDFKIELNNNILSISSEKKIENETKENERYTRREFSYQSFMRSFTLPDTIEGEKINAKYENGILNIHIPKKDEAKVKPVKQIKIK